MKIRINEIFASIQGEGIQSGLPTIFIRTTGCNLRCKWCDTKYAYSDGTEMDLEEIIQECEKFRIENICLTGGEPLLYRAESRQLIKMLVSAGYQVLVETNGSVSIENIDSRALISLDVKCSSSGESDKNIFANLDLIRETDQVKFIIKDNIDYQYARDIIRKYDLEKRTNVIFQPLHDQNNSFVKEMVAQVLADKLTVRVGLQLHKIIWGEEKGK